MNLSYKSSGVDIKRGNKLVEGIKPLANATLSPLALDSIGGFSALFKMPAGFKSPVLCSSTDGVGTKLLLALEHDYLDFLGIDLVAMCVNDLLCSKAKPLFFLDYFASSKLEKEQALRIIKGIANGCIESGCSLIGGESAEMPDLYQKGHFDLAGFALGVVEESEIPNKNNVKKGDILIGLPSSGLHSNGYSLVRKIIDIKGMGGLTPKSLLAPTIIYVKDVLKVKDKITALAHITGGGIIENLPRILPSELGADIIELELNKRGGEIYEFISRYVDKNERFRVFNMGVGMILIVKKDAVNDILRDINNSFILGEINHTGEIKLI